MKISKLIVNKGFEAHFSWFKLFLTEPDCVPGGIQTSECTLKTPYALSG